MREVPQDTEMIWGPQNRNGVTCCVIFLHVQLMSTYVAHVQLLADVLCLPSRPAQGSKCSGNHFRPSVSCVSLGLQVPLHLEDGVGEGLPTRGILRNSRLGPPARGVDWATADARGRMHRGAGWGAGRDGECKC